MAHKYNIIGTDRMGDWLIGWAYSQDEADFMVHRYQTDHKHTHYRRIRAVRCSA